MRRCWGFFCSDVLPSLQTQIPTFLNSWFPCSRNVSIAATLWDSSICQFSVVYLFYSLQQFIPNSAHLSGAKTLRRWNTKRRGRGPSLTSSSSSAYPQMRTPFFVPYSYPYPILTCSPHIDVEERDLGDAQIRDPIQPGKYPCTKKLKNLEYS